MDAATNGLAPADGDGQLGDRPSGDWGIHLRRSHRSGDRRIRVWLGALAAMIVWTASAPPGHAQEGVETRGCGDAASDFGVDCSLREVLYDNDDRAFVRIGGVLFNSIQYFELLSPLDPVADLSRIRVVPIGVGSSHPGIRFEPNGEWSSRNGFAGPVELTVAAQPAVVGSPAPLVGAEYQLSITQRHRIDELDNFEGGWVTGEVRVLSDNTDVTGAFAVPAIVDPAAGAPGGVVAFGSPAELASLRFSFDVEEASGEEFDGYAAVESLEASVLVGGSPAVPPGASETVENGTFDQGADGLAGWTAGGPGSVVAVATESGRAAIEVTTDGAPTTLTQVIDTPPKSFVIAFDHRFNTAVGSLDVLIGNAIIATVAAPAAPAFVFSHEEVLVNEVSLMGLAAATLTLRLNPGSTSSVRIVNVRSPVLPVATEGRITASGSASILSSTPVLRSQTDESALAARSEVEAASALGSMASATGIARGSSLLVPAPGQDGGVVEAPGIEYGGLASARSDANAPAAETGARAEADATVRSVVRATGIDPGTPIPIHYDLVLNGTISLRGNLAGPGRGRRSEVQVTLQGSIQSNRAARQAFRGDLTVSGPIGVQASGDTTGGEAVLAVENRDGQGNVIERLYTVSKTFHFRNALHVAFNDTLELRGRLRLAAWASRELDGTVVADFNNTLTATITTDAAGVTLMPVAPTDGGTGDGGAAGDGGGALADGGPASDGGGAPADGGHGSTNPPAGGGGCRCTAATDGSAGGVLFLLLLVVAGRARRRESRVAGDRGARLPDPGETN